jgi:hypothetical protein
VPVRVGLPWEVLLQSCRSSIGFDMGNLGYDVLPGGKIMPAREIKRWPAPAPPR